MHIEMHVCIEDYGIYIATYIAVSHGNDMGQPMSAKLVPSVAQSQSYGGNATTESRAHQGKQRSYCTLHLSATYGW